MPSLRPVPPALAFALIVFVGACGTPDSSGSHDASSGDSAATQDGAAHDGSTTGLDSGSLNPDAGPKDAGNSATDAGALGEPAALAGITAAHNVVRMNASPAPAPALPPLVWSDAVAAAAQAWANGCVYQHSSNGYGENIFASTATPTGQSVTTSWASESVNYDYVGNTCSGICGHYTQVVWRESTSLGCGVRTCSTNSPFDVMKYGPNWTLVVCDYSLAGNDGSRPY